MNTKRIMAACLAAVMLFGLCACTGTPDSSQPPDASADGTSEAGGTTGSTAAPTQPVPEGKYTYTLEELPDYGELPFSTEAVIPGDPDFEVGKYWSGPHLELPQELEMGVWMWDSRIIIGQDPATPGVTCDEMLDMLIQNGVTEIYLTVRADSYYGIEDLIESGGEVPDGMVSEMMLRGFIKKCSKFGIKVSKLEVIVGVPGLARFMPSENKSEEYYWTKQQYLWLADFNSRAAGEDEKLIGLHIDCEASWDDYGDPVENVQNFTDWLITMTRYAGEYDMTLGLDLLAGFYTRSAFMVTDETGATVPLMDVITRQCPSLTLMSYSYSNSKQFDGVRRELEYAKKNGCTLIVAAETGIPSQDNERPITYWSLDYPRFKEQQKKLCKKLKESGLEHYGIAIHYTASLWKLAERDRDLTE